MAREFGRKLLDALKHSSDPKLESLFVNVVKARIAAHKMAAQQAQPTNK